jgi:hypothetical protein
MTEQELNDNYEYKVTKRALLREFPFIKEVFIKFPDEIDKYNTMIFIDVVIDPYALSHMFGVKMDKVVDRYLRSGEPYWSPYISSYFADRDDSDDIKREIHNLLNGVHNSTAIPPELKLGKKLDIGSWYAYPESVPRLPN